jgi:hypothetical protein
MYGIAVPFLSCPEWRIAAYVSACSNRVDRIKIFLLNVSVAR